MFSKAKRFESLALQKNENNVNQLKLATEKPKKIPLSTGVAKSSSSVCSKSNTDAQSQCSSKKSTNSFATPKPVKLITTKHHSSIKKPPFCSDTKKEADTQKELIKAQEVEIKNKDYTISEYNKQIEDLKNKIRKLQNQIKELSNNKSKVQCLENKFSKISLSDKTHENHNAQINKVGQNNLVCTKTISELESKIIELEKQCDKLENEVRMKQLDITSLEEVITIRDTLCKDLQEKLSTVEAKLNETVNRLEMVKGHHELALEANESIRREYKADLEILKLKFEEEKQIIINKCKADQEKIKTDCNESIDSIRSQITKEKCEEIQNLQLQLATKDHEMKAKLEQIDEATSEKLKLCEIQFEERYQSIQEHYLKQQKTLEYLEKEEKELKCSLSSIEDQKKTLLKEIVELKNYNDLLINEKLGLIKEIDEIKEDSMQKVLNFESQINKLMSDAEKVTQEKRKFEMSLAVTRDIVQVLTARLRESDNELEFLEKKVQSLINSNKTLEGELTTYKTTLNNTVVECNEYKEALINILQSKAALAKEHTRIMEHNVTLVESLQNVEKEAYRELGSIKTELIEDVELLRQESDSQIKQLLEEVEKKRMLCELATEHAGQATAAAEQSRVLLAQAASEINRLEMENQCYQQQIQDQQSLVVELSLLRQENEELTMTVAKQSSLIDKMKRETEQIQQQYQPKSPSVLRKTHKTGKENLTTALSPLRERNY